MTERRMLNRFVLSNMIHGMHIKIFSCIIKVMKNVAGAQVENIKDDSS